MKGIDFRITVEKTRSGKISYQVFQDGRILDTTSELIDVLFDVKDAIVEKEQEL